MTYQKLTAQGLVAASAINEEKRPLNSELILNNRECQATLRESDRNKASTRNDVEQTTDKKAYCEMYEYLKSDTNTLDKHKDSKVASFYAGRSIFITGASGFVGKVSIRNVLAF